MPIITFEIISLFRIQLNLTRYPELSSKKKFIQKGIRILRQYSTGILKYLSRQHVIANLSHFDIVILTDKKRNRERIKHYFRLWIQKEKSKRIIYLIFEAIIIPFTGILAILPGPNFFFYVPALLFYYHLVSFLGLKKIDVDKLNLKIRSL
jgi:hypothetical protein